MRTRKKRKGTDDAVLAPGPRPNATNHVWVAVRMKKPRPGVGMAGSSGAAQPAGALQVALAAAPRGEFQPGVVAVPIIGRSVPGALQQAGPTLMRTISRGPDVAATAVGEIVGGVVVAAVLAATTR